MEKRTKDLIIVKIINPRNKFEYSMEKEFLWIEQDFRASSTHYKVTNGKTVFMIEKYKCLVKY